MRCHLLSSGAPKQVGIYFFRRHAIVKSIFEWEGAHTMGIIRKAAEQDVPAVAAIYDAILDREEAGLSTVGWIRGVYPTAETAREALESGTLFVLEDGGEVVAAARLDQDHEPAYDDCQWSWDAPDNQVMVLHTLVVRPDLAGRGYGRQFVAFYEQYARERGCPCLRLDTNERNAAARRLYAKLGYREAGIIPCVFNGIGGVNLVCLEKKV